MKVFALTVLLISICYVEGSLVKRQVEIPSNLTAQFTQFIRRLHNETEELVSSYKEIIEQTRVEDIRSQFDTAIQQLQDSFTSFTEHVKQNVGQFFTLPSQAQQPVEEGA